MPAAQAAAAREVRERRRNVLLLYVLSTFSTTSNGSMTFVLPLNLDRLGHPLPLVGTVVALIGLGSLLSRVAGAGLVPACPRSLASTMASFALMGCSTIALGLSDDGAVPGVLRRPLRLLLRPGDDVPAGVADRHSAAGRQRRHDNVLVHRRHRGRYTLERLLGAQSIERLGYGPAFLISGLVALAAAALTLTLRLPREAPSLPRSILVPPPPPVGRLRTVLSLPAGVWLGTLLVFYLTFIADTYQTFYPIYAVGIGVSVGTIGLLKVVHSIASTGVRFAGAGLFRIVSGRGREPHHDDRHGARADLADLRDGRHHPDGALW